MQTMPKHIFWPIINSSNLYATIYTRSTCYYTPNHWAWSLPVTWEKWRSNHSIRYFQHANCTALSVIEPQLLPIKFLHRENREFRVFLQKIVKILKFSVRIAHVMLMMPKHIFWPIIDSSSFYATGVMRDQGAVLSRIGGRGHFRSREIDGGLTFRSAIAGNSCYTQTAPLYHSLHGSVALL